MDRNIPQSPAAMPPAIPAATLILFDETSPGPARHLLLERSAAMAFAPGALVFPGGRVEAEDHLIAANPDLAANAPAAPEDAAARVAAIRETLEETGLAIAIRPHPDDTLLGAWRAALKTGAGFAPLLAAGGFQLQLGLLVPYAHWIPSHKLARRFDTRFYAAQREGAGAAAHDHDENARHLWLTAEQAVADAAAGLHQIIYPTLSNLQRLALYPSFAATLAHLAQTKLRVTTPLFREINGVMHIEIDADLGYPITSSPHEYMP